MGYKIWHIPQVPMESFDVTVESPQEGAKILKVLADYDDFQYKNNIKPDYSNASGLQEYDEKENEWCDWWDDDGDQIDEYIYGEKTFKEPK